MWQTDSVYGITLPCWMTAWSSVMLRYITEAETNPLCLSKTIQYEFIECVCVNS